jgi:hypothetical protein
VWEYQWHRNRHPARLVVETAAPGSERVWLGGCGTHVVCRADMTEANGWRFIGRAGIDKEGGAP